MIQPDLPDVLVGLRILTMRCGRIEVSVFQYYRSVRDDGMQLPTKQLNLRQIMQCENRKQSDRQT